MMGVVRTVLAVAACCWTALSAAQLRLYTEEYRPLSYSEKGVLSGMTVEVVESLIQRTGQPASIELVPWTRGYQQAQREANVGLFPAVRTPQREDKFQWVGPVAAGHTNFYSHAGSGLRVQSLADVERLGGVLAVPKLWYSYEILQEQGLQSLYGVPTPQHMVKMFKHGRVQLILANNLALDEMLAGQGMTRDQVEQQYTLMTNSTYIAFSLNTDAALVARWRQALNEMKRDGSLERIHRRWFAHASDEELAQALRME
jgi:polar amino acid transport system substrate-binding protein